VVLDSLRVPRRILDGDFAGWLRDAMTARGMTTRMLGMRSGLDHSTIYRLALGERQPSLATAVALLRILGEEAEEAIPGGNGHHVRSPDVSLR
jgi:transcriptional regulator with XRE-family HTH domain